MAFGDVSRIAWALDEFKRGSLRKPFEIGWWRAAIYEEFERVFLERLRKLRTRRNGPRMWQRRSKKTSCGRLDINHKVETGGRKKELSEFSRSFLEASQKENSIPALPIGEDWGLGARKRRARCGGVAGGGGGGGGGGKRSADGWKEFPGEKQTKTG